jgi:hypothetical protein
MSCCALIIVAPFPIDQTDSGDSTLHSSDSGDPRFVHRFRSSLETWRRDTTAPPIGCYKLDINSKVVSKHEVINVRSSCGVAEATSIQLIKDPSSCSKSQGGTRKIRPRMRNDAFYHRNRRSIGAVSRVSWTGLCLPCDESCSERKPHWRTGVPGKWPLEIETESRALKRSISTVRKRSF